MMSGSIIFEIKFQGVKHKLYTPRIDCNPRYFYLSI
jgi:hypothetical protein